MSCEIKFRAWDPINKRMYKNPFIVFDEYGAEAYDDHQEWEDCIQRKSILMQFTGLKDKDGKEIFEGDIVQSVHILPDYPIKIAPVIRESACEWSWCCFGHIHEALTHPGESFTIIGNIYETPELLPTPTGMGDTPVTEGGV